MRERRRSCGAQQEDPGAHNFPDGISADKIKFADFEIIRPKLIES